MGIEKDMRETAKSGQDPIPAGSTKQASDRDLRPGEKDVSGPGDRHAAGVPGGGTEFGRLGGTTEGDGAPTYEEQMKAADSFAGGDPEDEESGPPYGGQSGGAVGGTPAEGRSSGGTIAGGLRPGGVHRGDSTIGSDPESPKKE
ncbi:MAG: hypothetical protein JO112_13840 [Planctomycetes bacterium]|nr:hypothetical protein [Planctomycetota bacterium]